MFFRFVYLWILLIYCLFANVRNCDSVVIDFLKFQVINMTDNLVQLLTFVSFSSPASLQSKKI